MANSDDPKDRLDEVPNEKQPLGFEQEVAPADSRLAGRRLFLKLAFLGAAASMLPESVQAALQGGFSNEEAKSSVSLPYKNTLAFENQPGTLTDGQGGEAEYLVTGSGDVYIDAAGSIFLSNVKATGTYVSGKLDVGTISAVQPTPSMSGKYDGTRLDASTTVLYSDADVKQQPATLRMGGDLYRGGADLGIGVDFQRAAQPDWGVVVSWTKATC